MAGKERSDEEIQKALQDAWLSVPEDIQDDYLFVGVAIRKSTNTSMLVVEAGDEKVHDDMLGKIQQILVSMAMRVRSVKHTVAVRSA